MDWLYGRLDAVAEDFIENPLIRIAAKKGLMVLDKYYSRTDDSLIYWSAMSM
jgi:hypothetical protein